MGSAGKLFHTQFCCLTLLAAKWGDLHKLLWQYVCIDPTGSSATPQDPVCFLSSRKQVSEQLQPFCASLGYSSVTQQEPPGSVSHQGNGHNSAQARGVPRLTRSASSLCHSIWAVPVVPQKSGEVL